ncbi:thiol:disulfide interchange protein DsbA [Bradyrhizobiaceae bacterium SG-6C]|nr:thiol:disulfide interchange protein DsbA [Bradyrhizobiaceae bacterium SG-6C]
MNITRRTFTTALSMTAFAAALGVSPWQLIGEANAQTAAEIAQAGELGDMALGAKDAPVTIIEYASMTCPHCAAFTKDVFPQIKTAYIDTGKVRFIFREFPLDQVALAASALARCMAKDDAQKYFAIVDILFKQQNDLASDALGTINRVGKQAGFSEQMIKDCVQGDPKIQKGILDVREHAYKTLKVNSTPFFFVNGTPVRGETSFDAFEKMIKPLLKS